MAQIRVFLVFILTLFILTGCNLEQNSDDDASLSDAERSFTQEGMIIDASFILTEAGTELRVKLPNGVYTALSALSDFTSEIVTRDVNNEVQRWSLEIDENSSEVMESISFDASNINSVALHFYGLKSGAPIADCISISEFPNEKFSCAVRFLENVNGPYASTNNDQYINVNVKISSQFSLEGAVVSSECYGPLGILDEENGTLEAELSTFIPNYIYGVLEIYKEGQHVFLQRQYSSDGIGYYSILFPSNENTKPLTPNNAYTAQLLNLYGPEESLQTIEIPEYQSARKSAHIINSYEGISASAQTEVKMSVYNPAGQVSMVVNGQLLQYIDVETLLKNINKNPKLFVTASIDQGDNLILIDELGDDLSIELCSSYAENQLTILGNPLAGPIVLGSSPTADRIVTIGGTITWQEEEDYELEMPINSFLALQAGEPNTQIPTR